MKISERFEYFFWGCIVSAAVYVSLQIVGLEDDTARAALAEAVTVIKSYHPAIVAAMVAAVSASPFLPRAVHAAMRPLIDRFNRRLSSDYEQALNLEAEKVVNGIREEQRDKIRRYGEQDRNRRMEQVRRMEDLERQKNSAERMRDQLAEVLAKYDAVSTAIAEVPSGSAGGKKNDHAARLEKRKGSVMEEMRQALSMAQAQT